MTELSASRLIGCLALGALALGGAAGAPAQAPPSEERLVEQVQTLKEGLGAGAAPPGQETRIDPAAAAKVQKRVADELGVEVLDVRPIETEFGPAYAVKVMNPGGNSNDAFMVSTLIVDRESGRVLGQLRQSIRTAAEFSEGGPGTDGNGLTIRRRTYR